MTIAESFQGVILAIQGVFSNLLNNIILAIVILLTGLIIGKILGRLTKKFLEELETDTIIKKATKLRMSVEEFAAGIVSYFVYFVAVIMSLNQLGLTTTLLYFITAGFILLVVLSFFLAIKDFIPNLVAGIYIHEKMKLKEGDTIAYDSIEGTITKITIIDTIVKTKKGDTLYIPNSHITKNSVIKKN